MIMSSYFNVQYLHQKNDKDLCWYSPKPHFARSVSNFGGSVCPVLQDTTVSWQGYKSYREGVNRSRKASRRLVYRARTSNHTVKQNRPVVRQSGLTNTDRETWWENIIKSMTQLVCGTWDILRSYIIIINMFLSF